MYGLPFSTFFFVYITPLIGVVVALIYGFTYKEDEDWWTLDELFSRGGNKNGN